MRLHTGDKPYVCHICHRRFAQSNAHSYHMKTHFGEKPFSCDICSKTFTTNGQLINHRRLHTGTSLQSLMLNRILLNKFWYICISSFDFRRETVCLYNVSEEVYPKICLYNSYYDPYRGQATSLQYLRQKILPRQSACGTYENTQW